MRITGLWQDFMNNLGSLRMPAEWEEQRAIWMSWPLSDKIWPKKKSIVEHRFAEIIQIISRSQKCCINCIIDAQDHVKELLHSARLDNIEFFDHPTNDVWCRDHGPIFVKDEIGRTLITDWNFNGWGGKFDYNLDTLIPKLISESLSLPRLIIPIIGEGGGIEVNGHGVLITTESVFLNKNRNKGINRPYVEEIFNKYLGINQTIWLEKGMASDDTDGHIDTLTRFINKDTVITVYDEKYNHPDSEIFNKNRKKLEKYFNVIPIQVPNLIEEKNGNNQYLPATYANFLITNEYVLVPTYRQYANDNAALRIIDECFQSREIIPVDCFDIISEGGAIHCLTQQEPVR